MENITPSKEEYEKMKIQIKRFKELERVDFELVRQFKKGLEDLKAGRMRRVA